MMHRIFFIFFILFASSAHADIFSEEVREPLLKHDYQGKYHAIRFSETSDKKKPKIVLKIKDNFSAVFLIMHADGKRKQHFFKRAKLIDSLLVYKKIPNGAYEMQMVVDGYKQGADKYLTTTIYLYKDGMPRGVNNTEKILFKAVQ